jgi:hypothetical protein
VASGFGKYIDHATAGKAWFLLVKYIDDDGNITEVCEGTGTSNDWSLYLNRKPNTGDFDGQTPMLWFAAALLRQLSPFYFLRQLCNICRTFSVIIDKQQATAMSSV